MDSFRYDGNAIHIIGGDDKPDSETGNEYDTASGGTTSDLSYGGNAVDADRSIAIQKMLFKTKMCVELGSGTCQNATNCNFAHSIAELRSPPTVTIKAKIDVVKEICEALTPTQFEIFEKTCFGHWLNVGLKKNSQLLIHTVLACMVEGKENELSFLILGKQIHFRRQEFCLVTGLRFGCNMYMKKWVKNLTDNPFRNRIFPHIKANVSVKLGDVIDIFDKMRKRTLVLEDNDAVRICLLVLLQQGFLGHQLSHNVSDDMLKLVEHLSNCWNIFPWGSYIWQYTYSQLRDALPRRKLLHDAKREKGEKIQYTMTGFVWAFMIWILEAIPATHRYVHKQPTEKIPRALAWESTQPFTWSRCCTLFVGDQLAPPLETLTPTKAESETDWWKASLEYFEVRKRYRKGKVEAKKGGGGVGGAESEGESVGEREWDGLGKGESKWRGERVIVGGKWWKSQRREEELVEEGGEEREDRRGEDRKGKWGLVSRGQEGERELGEGCKGEGRQGGSKERARGRGEERSKSIKGIRGESEVERSVRRKRGGVEGLGMGVKEEEEEAEESAWGGEEEGWEQKEGSGEGRSEGEGVERGGRGEEEGGKEESMKDGHRGREGRERERRGRQRGSERGVEGAVRRVREGGEEGVVKGKKEEEVGGVSGEKVCKEGTGTPTRAPAREKNFELKRRLSVLRVSRRREKERSELTKGRRGEEKVYVEREGPRGTTKGRGRVGVKYEERTEGRLRERGEEVVRERGDREAREGREERRGRDKKGRRKKGKGRLHEGVGDTGEEVEAVCDVREEWGGSDAKAGSGRGGGVKKRGVGWGTEIRGCGGRAVRVEGSRRRREGGEVGQERREGGEGEGKVELGRKGRVSESRETRSGVRERKERLEEGEGGWAESGESRGEGEKWGYGRVGKGAGVDGERARIGEGRRGHGGGAGVREIEKEGSWKRGGGAEVGEREVRGELRQEAVRSNGGRVAWRVMRTEMEGERVEAARGEKGKEWGGEAADSGRRRKRWIRGGERGGGEELKQGRRGGSKGGEEDGGREGKRGGRGRGGSDKRRRERGEGDDRGSRSGKEEKVRGKEEFGGREKVRGGQAEGRGKREREKERKGGGGKWWRKGGKGGVVRGVLESEGRSEEGVPGVVEERSGGEVEKGAGDKQGRRVGKDRRSRGGRKGEEEEGKERRRDEEEWNEAAGGKRKERVSVEGESKKEWRRSGEGSGETMVGGRRGAVVKRSGKSVREGGRGREEGRTVWGKGSSRERKRGNRRLGRGEREDGARRGSRKERLEGGGAGVRGRGGGKVERREKREGEGGGGVLKCSVGRSESTEVGGERQGGGRREERRKGRVGEGFGSGRVTGRKVRVREGRGGRRGWGSEYEQRRVGRRGESDVRGTERGRERQVEGVSRWEAGRGRIGGQETVRRGRGKKRWGRSEVVFGGCRGGAGRVVKDAKAGRERGLRSLTRVSIVRRWEGRGGVKGTGKALGKTCAGSQGGKRGDAEGGSEVKGRLRRKRVRTAGGEQDERRGEKGREARGEGRAKWVGRGGGPGKVGGMGREEREMGRVGSSRKEGGRVEGGRKVGGGGWKSKVGGEERREESGRERGGQKGKGWERGESREGRVEGEAGEGGDRVRRRGLEGSNGGECEKRWREYVVSGSTEWEDMGRKRERRGEEVERGESGDGESQGEGAVVVKGGSREEVEKGGKGVSEARVEVVEDSGAPREEDAREEKDGVKGSRVREKQVCREGEKREGRRWCREREAGGKKEWEVGETSTGMSRVRGVVQGVSRSREWEQGGEGESRKWRKERVGVKVERGEREGRKTGVAETRTGVVGRVKGWEQSKRRRGKEWGKESEDESGRRRGGDREEGRLRDGEE
ncbi:phospholipase-like protein [Tanacetum coccineum]